MTPQGATLAHTGNVPPSQEPGYWASSHQPKVSYRRLTTIWAVSWYEENHGLVELSFLVQLQTVMLYAWQCPPSSSTLQGRWMQGELSAVHKGPCEAPDRDSQH